jgi:hypothetical protein
MCIVRCYALKMGTYFLDNHARDQLRGIEMKLYTYLLAYHITYTLNKDTLCWYSFLLRKLRRLMYVGTFFCSIHAFLPFTPLFFVWKMTTEESSLEYFFLHL